MDTELSRLSGAATGQQRVVVVAPVATSDGGAGTVRGAAQGDSGRAGGDSSRGISRQRTLVRAGVTWSDLDQGQR